MGITLLLVVVFVEITRDDKCESKDSSKMKANLESYSSLLLIRGRKCFISAHWGSQLTFKIFKKHFKKILNVQNGGDVFKQYLTLYKTIHTQLLAMNT